MAAFDPELYLRLAAERDLLELAPRHHPGATPLGMAAGALVATGCLGAGEARAVLGEYASARALRSRDVQELFWHVHADQTPEVEAREPFPPRRTFAVGQELEHRLGPLRVEYVSLGPDATVVAGAVKVDTSSMHSPPSFKLTDDTGRTEYAEFDGHGWEDDGFQGRFTTEEPLSATTAWIEVDGTRVALTRAVAPPEVRIEAVPERDPALRFLWRLAVPDAFGHEATPVEPAIEALVAAGRLPHDHAELDAIRAVAASGGSTPKRSLPEPYRSLRRGGQGRGPKGTLVIGAVTPVFDGFAVAVDALESGPDGWSLAVRVSPSALESSFDPGALPGRQLTWWAADDRRHTYLGQVGSWGGGDEHATGTLYFEGALDPKASVLELHPTADEQRAVIRVPLEWP